MRSSRSVLPGVPGFEAGDVIGERTISVSVDGPIRGLGFPLVISSFESRSSPRRAA